MSPEPVAAQSLSTSSPNGSTQADAYGRILQGLARACSLLDGALDTAVAARSGLGAGDELDSDDDEATYDPWDEDEDDGWRPTARTRNAPGNPGADDELMASSEVSRAVAFHGLWALSRQLDLVSELVGSARQHSDLGCNGSAEDLDHPLGAEGECSGLALTSRLRVATANARALTSQVLELIRETPDCLGYAEIADALSEDRLQQFERLTTELQAHLAIRPEHAGRENDTARAEIAAIAIGIEGLNHRLDLLLEQEQRQVLTRDAWADLVIRLEMAAAHIRGIVRATGPSGIALAEHSATLEQLTRRLRAMHATAPIAERDQAATLLSTVAAFAELAKQFAKRGARTITTFPHHLRVIERGWRTAEGGGVATFEFVEVPPGVTDVELFAQDAHGQVVGSILVHRSRNILPGEWIDFATGVGSEAVAAIRIQTIS